MSAFHRRLLACLLATVLPGACSQHAARDGVDRGHPPELTLDRGAVVRGDRSQKRLALIFTGGEHGEGTEHILDVLAKLQIRASFFLTGDYLRKPEHTGYLPRMTAEGHYVGPHSDSHPLYCDWKERAKTLVSEAFFREDLEKNISELRQAGALPAGQTLYFIPPYEWFNEDQAAWSRSMGIVLFNFTPGSGSNRDWAPEGHPSFVSSCVIMADILACEQRDPDGLNGFLLLMHLGAQRRDKPFLRLEPLLVELKARGYAFERIDSLLRLNVQAGDCPAVDGRSAEW